jgi:anti-sigma28 factor (negative regulator of flagellin synthesis)
VASGKYIKKGEDKIIPPARSVELKRIKRLIHKSPDIREDMVADLRTRVLGGIYKVKPEQVAEKIIQHGIYILGALEGNGCCPL